MDTNERINLWQNILLKNAVNKQRIEAMENESTFMPYAWHKKNDELYASTLADIKTAIATLQELREKTND